MNFCREFIVFDTNAFSRFQEIAYIKILKVTQISCCVLFKYNKPLGTLIDEVKYELKYMQIEEIRWVVG